MSEENEQENLGHLMDILEGKREPETDFEKYYLTFMGGVSRKEDRPQRWVKCANCGVEWKTTGFPCPTGGWYWASICSSCADLRDAKLKQKPSEPEFPEDRRSKHSRFADE